MVLYIIKKENNTLDTNANHLYNFTMLKFNNNSTTL